MLHTKLSIRANRRFFTPFAALENINDPVFDNYKEVSALKKKKPEKKVFKPIVETIKEPLEFKLDIVDFNDLSKEQFEASR